MTRSSKIILIFIILFQNCIFSEQHIIKEVKVFIGAVSTGVLITAKLEINYEERSLGKLWLYFKSGYNNNALTFNKEQRVRMISLYNKFEDWQRIAIDKNVKSHSKDAGIVSSVVSYINFGNSWSTLKEVDLVIGALVGENALLTINIPKRYGVFDRYVSAPQQIIGIPNDFEELMITSPEVVFEIFDEEKLQIHLNKILKQQDKKNKLDVLFN